MLSQICLKVKIAAVVTNFLFEAHCAMAIADEADEVPPIKCGNREEEKEAWHIKSNCVVTGK